MKEQYQKEVSQIHVPSELLLRTKQAMKEEEERLGEEKRAAKVIPFRMMSIAAAVLAIAIVIPLATGFLGKEGKEEMKTPGVQLAGTVKPQLGAISKGDKEQSKELTITEADRMPKEWSDLEEITVAGKLIIITTDEETGFWMAYDEQKKVVVASEIIEKEAFLEALENEL